MRAREETPQRSGIAERVVRSIKMDLAHLLLGVTVQSSKALIAQVTLARNHGPPTVAGIHPALEITGRRDLLEGRAATAWNHDPQSIGPVARHLNSTRNILNARNAIITDDEKGQWALALIAICQIEAGNPPQ